MKPPLLYAAGTLLRMLLLLLGVSVVCFLLIISSPIDPVDAYVGAESNVSQQQRDNVAAHWGLDKPPLSRYVTWLSNLLKGDMGTSIAYQRPVAQVLGERFLASLTLMLTAWVLSGALGFLLGIVSGVKEGGLLDRTVRGVCYVFSSTPAFWVGLLLIMLFAVKLQWLPIGLSAPAGKLAADVTFADRVRHLILPAVTLSVTGVSHIALHTRQKLLEVMNSDYALFARARGGGRWTILRRHGLRNIAIPAVTLQFASFSELFGGSVLAETVFAYPGLGNAATVAGLRGDVPLLLGVALCAVVFVFAGNLTANLLYGVLDPRIREGGRAS